LSTLVLADSEGASVDDRQFRTLTDQSFGTESRALLDDNLQSFRVKLAYTGSNDKVGNGMTSEFANFADKVGRPESLEDVRRGKRENGLKKMRSSAILQQRENVVCLC
jgi:hypothetical protein